MFTGWNWITVIRLGLSLIIVIGILSKAKFTEVVLKVWSGILIIGGVLGLISIFMYLIIGSFEKIEILKLFTHIFYIIIGYMISSFWNSSILVEENER